MKRAESYAWGLAFLLLAAFAIPWFMWRSDATAFGLPLWLWYHIGWMLIAMVVFYGFGRRAWGIWIEQPSPDTGRPDGGG